MKFSILTLFPEALEPYFQSSIVGRAKKSGKLEVELIQIRDFSRDRHRKVDDAPFGGGAGMVMSVQPLRDALHHVLRAPMLCRCGGEEGSASPEGLFPSAPAESKNTSGAEEIVKWKSQSGAHVVLMSPRGSLLTQSKCEEFSGLKHLVLVCGHYEGVDQRFIDRYVDEEISIGDYVLTGGELAAAVVVDAVSRLSDHVLGSRDSLDFESHSSGLLEYPHYTRPEEIDGDRVPEILLSGHHQKIDLWRLSEAERITRERRPDLHAAYLEKKGRTIR